MLDDRSYMRDPMYGSRRSMVLNIIIALAICFVIQNLLLFYSSFGSLVRGADGNVYLKLFYYLGLTPYTIGKGWLWQLVTFNFLHAPFGAGGFFHILFNCWAIWVFGQAIEEAIGPRKTLALFLVTGIAGGVLQSLGMLFLPTHFGSGAVGASAGVFGLIAAYAAIFPARQITMLLFFVLPVTITARFLLIFSGLVALFGILVPSGNVAHGAHLGGLLAGLAFVRWGLQNEWSMPRLPSFRRPKVFVHTRQASTWPARTPKTDMPSDEFISQEVDPILDKISAHGIQSLTERERKILEAARAKMARR
jgi:membrane associated rhomboid family serine protease